MREWGERTLDECLSSLIDYRGKSPKKSDAGIPVISAKVVKDGRIVHPVEQTIEPGYYREWMRRGLPQIGDVVLTTEGPLGEVAQLDPQTARYALGQRIVVLRGKENVLNSTFLKFLLQSPLMQERLHAFATGTTVSGISQKALRSVPMPVPPIEEQQCIAELLGSLDDKIELNRRLNETLEAMAQAIFRDWFVDFGPTRRKLDGASDPVTIMGGLVTDPDRARELAELFPQRLGDDGLPEGWIFQPLGEVTNVTKGRSYKSAELVQSNTALVTLKSFQRGGGYRPDGLKSYAGTFRPEQVVEPGEIIVAQTDVTQAAEVIGRPALVRSDVRFDTLVASLDVAIVRPHCNALTREFLFWTLNSDRFTQHALAHVTGTTVLHLAKNALPEFAMVQPGPDLDRAFCNLVMPSMQQNDRLHTESGILAATRDLLLPKLMSGGIRIRDAEAELEAAQ